MNILENKLISGDIVLIDMGLGNTRCGQIIKKTVTKDGIYYLIHTRESSYFTF